MPSRRPFALIGAAVFTGETIDSGRAVIIDGDTIQAVVPAADLPAGLARVPLAGGLLAPGFIDLQVNGGGGVLFNDHPDPAALRTITTAHRRFGTTGLMATLISDQESVRRRAAAAVRAAGAAGMPGLLGLHFEGPHLNPARAGVHQRHHLRPLTNADLAWMVNLDLGAPLMVTLAPEIAGAEAISTLANGGIVVAAGHTDASYTQMNAAFRAGVTCVTHLFNAMSPLTSREPGAVGAALDAEHVYCGIIVDGHHVHDATLRIAWRSKARGRLFLVTDAMPPVGTAPAAAPQADTPPAGGNRPDTPSPGYDLPGYDPPGFDLQGTAIRVEDGLCRTEDGRLAGSTLDMATAVRHCVTRLGLPKEEALRMAAMYPAHCLGLAHRLGRIAPGYRADLVLLDDLFDSTDDMILSEGGTSGGQALDGRRLVRQTWIAGVPAP